MTDEFSQYEASNFLRNKKDDFSQYEASNFIKKKPKKEKQSLLERAANDVREHINEPIESLGRSARNAAGGFAQGMANIAPGLWNLGASGANALGANIPKSPTIDLVPHGLSATAGEAASFFAPGGALKLLGRIPEVSHISNAILKIPQIAHAIKEAGNILGKAPMTSKIAGNAALGGAYSPDNPLLGMGLGAAGGALGEGISKGYSGIVNSLEEKGLSSLKQKDLFSTKKVIKNNLLKEHDLLENRASQAFENVSKEVNKRGISKIPESSFPKKLFNDMKQYFPNTRASSDLLEKAKSGDYSAIRKLQTDLYTRGKKNISAELEADRLKGEEMLEKRNDINELISNHLKNTGHHDLDKILSGARKDWSTLQNTYYNENIGNPLKKMFDKDIRKVPNNLIKLLGQESIPMNNLLKAHPGLKEKIAGHTIGKNVLKKGAKYGVPAGVGLLGYEYGKGH